MHHPIDLRNEPVPEDYWLNKGVYNFPKYKGVYYAYDKYTEQWILYENFYYGWVRYFNADKYRIDQCFDEWFKNDFK